MQRTVLILVAVYTKYFVLILLCLARVYSILWLCRACAVRESVCGCAMTERLAVFHSHNLI